MSDDDGWIVIPNWDRYQHYHDRDPTWIKDYASQLADDDWLKLTLSERGALQTVRLMYAECDGQLPLRRTIRALVYHDRRAKRTLEALNHAGFIAIVATRPLALARSREKRREEKNERASATPKTKTPTTTTTTTTNGHATPQPEPIAAIVDQASLELARRWLRDQTHRAPASEWAPTEQEPF